MADGEAILVYSECPHCGVQLPDDHGHSITLEVQLVEARDSAPGWIASGTGSRADGRTGFCPNCGMLCAEIVRRFHQGAFGTEQRAPDQDRPRRAGG